MVEGQNTDGSSGNRFDGAFFTRSPHPAIPGRIHARTRDPHRVTTLQTLLEKKSGGAPAWLPPMVSPVAAKGPPPSGAWVRWALLFRQKSSPRCSPSPRGAARVARQSHGPAWRWPDVRGSVTCRHYALVGGARRRVPCSYPEWMGWGWCTLADPGRGPASGGALSWLSAVSTGNPTGWPFTTAPHA
jgi:hypothetical protein